MNTLNTLAKMSMLVAVSMFATSVDAAILGGDVIAVDLSTAGGSATNYNTFNANGSIRRRRRHSTERRQHGQ